MRRLARSAVPLLIAGAGAILIVQQLAASRPLWLDEEMIALNVRDRAVSELAAPLWMGQSAPLGWLVAQKLVTLAAGTSEAALRVLPALFGIATGFLAAVIGLRWLNAAGAAALALLCTFSLWLSHFPLEVKHYSSDALWGLALPALAVWVAESSTAARFRRRAAMWWALAAAGHWLSNGAIFAAPAGALVIVLTAWRRFGIREAAICAAMGAGWLASFAIYYQLSLVHTHRSEFLRSHWSNRFPPAGLSAYELTLWIWRRLPELAECPVGTEWWRLFWAASVIGFLAARNRLLSLSFALLPVSAIVLGVIGFVPLHHRFALWMAPALFAGVALLVDRAVHALMTSGTRVWLRAAAVPALVVALVVSADVVRLTARDLPAREPSHNHGYNDRSGIEWVRRMWRPGDALITTRNGWPAVWWYAPELPRRDVFTVEYVDPIGCMADRMLPSLRAHSRAIVYFGFPDPPDAFGELILRHLDRIGAVARHQTFGHGYAAVFDLHTPGAPEDSLFLAPREIPADVPPGCPSLIPVERF